LLVVALVGNLLMQVRFLNEGECLSVMLGTPTGSARPRTADRGVGWLPGETG
jgi:hypothetical protein